MLDGQLLDWLGLLVRWLHVITGIAWIGASFYFIWLDLSLEPVSGEKAERGLKGELWSIHGGGIYEVGKYRLAPPVMPETLHWFKWEAYSTWMTGTLLLILLYYVQAQSYLVDADSWLQSPGVAVVGSLAFLAAGIVAYESCVRLGWAAAGAGFAVGFFLLLLGLSWLAFQLFSPRAAMLHLGALLGTIMAGNVFLGIMPSQRALIDAIETGTEPPVHLADLAKQRSTHNNYFTLPVLFCMLANHASFVFGHPYAWALVPLLGACAAYGRHYFNLKHRGEHRPRVLAGAAVGAVALFAVATSILPARAFVPTPDSSGEPITAAAVTQVLAARCAGCHAPEPSFAGYVAPPGGLIFLKPADLLAHRGRVLSSLQSGYMPLGNLTGITDKERALLLAFTAQE
ncbi:MAG: urate hydroxylase PuuD [Pseudomonadota bacterium]